MGEVWTKFKELPVAVTGPVIVLVLLALLFAFRVVRGGDANPAGPGGGQVACQTDFDPSCEGDLEPRSGG